MLIGICGKSGSGKSTISNYLKDELGAIHCDIDKVGHKALTNEEVKKELIKNYGNDILNNNSVDRKRLGEIVFNSRLEMKKLSDITWKHMQIEIDKFLMDNKDKIIILDWLLLPISKYFDKCNIKILLDIPYEIRKERAIKRDNISEEAFDLREKASITYNKNDFDYVFNTVNNEHIRKLVKVDD